MEGRYHTCERLNGTVQCIKHGQPVRSMWLAAFYQGRRATVVPMTRFRTGKAIVQKWVQNHLSHQKSGEEGRRGDLPLSLPCHSGDSYSAKPTAPTFPGVPAAPTASDHGAPVWVCTSPGRCRMLRHPNLEQTVAGGHCPNQLTTNNIAHWACFPTISIFLSSFFFK